MIIPCGLALEVVFQGERDLAATRLEAVHRGRIAQCAGVDVARQREYKFVRGGRAEYVGKVRHHLL